MYFIIRCMNKYKNEKFLTDQKFVPNTDDYFTNEYKYKMVVKSKVFAFKINKYIFYYY